MISSAAIKYYIHVISNAFQTSCKVSCSGDTRALQIRILESLFYLTHIVGYFPPARLPYKTAQPSDNPKELWRREEKSLHLQPHKTIVIHKQCDKDREEKPEFCKPGESMV